MTDKQDRQVTEKIDGKLTEKNSSPMEACILARRLKNMPYSFQARILENLLMRAGGLHIAGIRQELECLQKALQEKFPTPTSYDLLPLSMDEKDMWERIWPGFLEKYFSFLSEEPSQEEMALAEKDLAAGICTLDLADPNYPKNLLHTPDPPPFLWVLGDLPVEEINAHFCVSMVGSRKATTYGLRMARDIAEHLASLQALVVSGMALGIDGASQEALLAKGGVSLGVLACGVNYCYPYQHRRLYQAIIRQGLILSENPPDTPPKRYLFPMRNRIIAGLSEALLVIQAGAQSGTKITVNYALDYDRQVMAVPGPVTIPESLGCHRLIQDGAAIYCGPDDLDRLFVRTIDPAYTYPVASWDEILASYQEPWDILVQSLDFRKLKDPRALQDLRFSWAYPEKAKAGKTLLQDKEGGTRVTGKSKGTGKGEISEKSDGTVKRKVTGKSKEQNPPAIGRNLSEKEEKLRLVYTAIESGLQNIGQMAQEADLSPEEVTLIVGQGLAKKDLVKNYARLALSDQGLSLLQGLG